MYRRRISRSLIALSLIGVASTPVLAQAASDSNGNAVNNDHTETIYVQAKPGRDWGRTEFSGRYDTDRMATATGLSLRPEDTPQSVSVISRQRIEDQQLESVVDIVDNTLGIYARPMDNDRYSITARGMTVDTILYDGVPTQYDTRFNYGDNLMNSSLYDRVEIVRGATGLMTGSGNPSAAINLVRKMPTREFHGQVSVTGGSWNRRGTELDLSGSLTGNGDLRGRLVAAGSDQESFQDRYEQQKRTLYGVLQADLTEHTTLTLGGDYQSTDPRGTMSGGLPLFYSDGPRTDYPRRASTAPSWASAETESAHAFARLEHRFNERWQLSASYTRGDNSLDYDVLWATGNPDPLTNEGAVPGSITFIAGERIQRTIDLQLTGSYDLFGREHELALGWNDRHKEFENPYFFPTDETPDLGNFLAPDFSYPKPIWADTKGTDSFGTTEQSAGYAVTRLSLAEPLTLILGARATSWETDQDSFGTLVQMKVDDEVSRYGGAVYELTPTLSAYAGYSEVFAPQENFNTEGTYLDPVEGSSREIGLKGRFLDDALSASLSVFDIRQDNLAEPVQGETLPGGIQVYEGVDGTQTTGAELELTGQLTERWQLSAGYTDFSAEAPDGEDINTDSPRRQFKLFTHYQFGGNWRGLSLGGGVNWQSRSYRAVENPVHGEVTVSQDTYQVITATLGYAFSDQLNLNLTLNNALDETYYAQLGQFNQYQYGAPRNVKANLSYRF